MTKIKLDEWKASAQALLDQMTVQMATISQELRELEYENIADMD